MKEKANLEHEGKAIQDISKILRPLNMVSKKNVMEYVSKSLGFNENLNHSNSIIPQKSSIFEFPAPKQSKSPTKTGQKEIMDIRSLAEQKKPRTATEKIVLVGFYLSEIAKGSEKTEQFSSNQIEKYFKQAKFKLPANIFVELNRAKLAGYIENAQRGKYKLNPVGYNLIAYNLPEKSILRKTNFKKTAIKKSSKKIRLKKRS